MIFSSHKNQTILQYLISSPSDVSVFSTTLNTFAIANSIDVEGCTNPFACNYNPEATIDMMIHVIL